MREIPPMDRKMHRKLGLHHFDQCPALRLPFYSALPIWRINPDIVKARSGWCRWHRRQTAFAACRDKRLCCRIVGSEKPVPTFSHDA
jgi:hypothetical protein